MSKIVFFLFDRAFNYNWSILSNIQLILNFFFTDQSIMGELKWKLMGFKIIFAVIYKKIMDFLRFLTKFLDMQNSYKQQLHFRSSKKQTCDKVSTSLNLQNQFQKCSKFPQTPNFGVQNLKNLAITRNNPFKICLYNVEVIL